MIRGLGILSILLAAPCLFAQGNAVIFGSVTDPSGANVAQVAVTATNEATGVTESVKSNDAGNYIFPDNFGRIITAGNPRIMQLAGKFYF